MSYLRFLREYLQNIPNSIQDGSIYFKKSNRALSIDLDKRYRINPPSDWLEDNTEDPAYIANKPELGTVASYDVATSLSESDAIPTTQLLNNALNTTKSQITSMVGRPQVASTLQEMADITKVYVYDGTNDPTNDLVYGYWYYFDTATASWTKGTEYGGNLSITTFVDDTLEIPNVPADSKATGDKITEVNDRIDQLVSYINQLNYVSLELKRFSISPTSSEVATSVSRVTVTVEFNKLPDSATIQIKQNGSNSSIITYDLLTAPQQYVNSYTFTIPFNINISQNSPIVLNAVDNGNSLNPAVNITETRTFLFLNKLYYGAKGFSSNPNENFINSLSSELNNKTSKTYTISAVGESMYIWFAMPLSFGTPIFTDKETNFTGGFTHINDYWHRNQNDTRITEQYQVWRSDHPNLGTNVKIAVSY